MKPEFSEEGNAVINVLIQAYTFKKQCLNYTRVFRGRKRVTKNMLKTNRKKNYTQKYNTFPQCILNQDGRQKIRYK